MDFNKKKIRAVRKKVLNKKRARRLLLSNPMPMIGVSAHWTDSLITLIIILSHCKNLSIWFWFSESDSKCYTNEEIDYMISMVKNNIR